MVSAVYCGCATLPYAGKEQPDANGPEHEPLADQKHDIGGAAEPQRFDKHARRRQ
jgi:hypothetical protein